MSENEEKNNAQDRSEDKDSFPPVSHADLTEPIGTQIGPYKILSILGEGGFGIVYLAEQKKPVRRQVALKVIKPGMDSKQVIARFEAEEQALALLDHPNIAHVFDAGTTEEGRPYFAMEYVKGTPITRHCDHHKLAMEERLKLFLQVCEAIQHAHQKGIIHRDIKPSNILVSVQGGKAIPKIIDFGVAKALSQPLTERTLFTEQGQLIGTPEYMSPEQAEMIAQDIDTRTDIYSLGVVLYELLTGALPFDPETLRKAAFNEIQRVIQEEDPPRPSTRLSSLGEEATNVAKNRRTDVRRLVKRLQTELEWIPLKAMRKERDRRYTTASAFAEDIRNYLNGDPLLAGPESALYRAVKFARRNQTMVASITTVFLVLLAAAVISTYFLIREKEARKSEQDQKIKALEARTDAERARKTAEENEEEANRNAESLRRSSYFSLVQLAGKEIFDGDWYRAQQLLSLCPRDLREWEWYYLWRVLSSVSISLHGHTSLHIGVVDITSGTYGTTIYNLAFSPDGKKIAAGGENSEITIWSAATGVQLNVLKGHVGAVKSLAFSPDGQMIISSDDKDKRIRVWDVATGSQINEIGPCDANICCVAFGPHGNQIGSMNSKGTVSVWDANDLSILQTMSLGITEDLEPSQIAFSPDGADILVVGSGKLKKWNIASNTLVLELPIDDGQSINCASYSPDGSHIAFSTRSRIKIIDINDPGNEVLNLPRNSRIAQVVYGPEGRYILWGDANGRVGLRDVKEKEEAFLVTGHAGNALFNIVGTSLAFSPNGQQIASTGREGAIQIWNWRQLDQRTEKSFSIKGSVKLAKCFPDGIHMIAGNENGTLDIWDTKTDKDPILSLNVGSQIFDTDPNCNRIASVSKNGMIRIWSVQDGSLQNVVLHTMSNPKDMAFSQNGKNVVVVDKKGAGSSCMIHVFDFPSLKCKNTFVIQSEVYSVALSSNGNQVITGGDQGVYVWDTASGVELYKLTNPQPSKTIAVSLNMDGSLIISGNLKGKVSVWESKTGKRQVLCDHGAAVSCVAISPNSRRIASCGSGGILRVWDASEGSEVIDINIGLPASKVSFSPHGRAILVGCTDGQVRIWESGSEAETSLNSFAANFLRQKAIELSDQGDRNSSISCMREAVYMYQKSFGQDHWLTARAKVNLADLLTRGGEARLIQEAYSLMLEVVSTLKKRFERVPYSEFTGVWETLRRLSYAPNLDKSRRDNVIELLDKDILDPDDLNRAAWSLVRSDGCDIKAYRQGLRKAQLAVQKSRILSEFKEYLGKHLVTLGVAYYRMNQNAKAIDTLSQALGTPVSDKDIINIFQALSWWRRGNRDEALSSLRKFTPDFAAMCSDLSKSSHTQTMQRTDKRAKQYDYLIEIAEMFGDAVRGNKAILPQPYNGYNNVNPSGVTLRWIPAKDIIKQHVYWGTNPKDLNLLKTINEEASLDLRAMKPDQKYFWRVDAVRRDRSQEQGESWTFSTGKLVCLWTFEEVLGKTVVDVSGNGNKGQIFGGGRRQSGPHNFSNAMLFDGNNDYIKTDLNASHFGIKGNSSKTFAMWIFVERFNAGGIFDVGTYNYGYNWALKELEKDNCYRLQFYGEGFDHDFYLDSLKKWVHLALVHDGRRTRLYADGDMVFDIPRVLLIGERETLQLGRWWTKYYFEGAIDDFRIYNYALNEEEIKDLYEDNEQ